MVAYVVRKKEKMPKNMKKKKKKKKTICVVEVEKLTSFSVCGPITLTTTAATVLPDKAATIL